MGYRWGFAQDDTRNVFQVFEKVIKQGKAEIGFPQKFGLVAAAGDEDDGDDDQPDPIVIEKIAQTVVVHKHKLLLKRYEVRHTVARFDAIDALLLSYYEEFAEMFPRDVETCVVSVNAVLPMP